MDSKKIIVALDFDSEQKALELVRQLDAKQCRLKVGKELFTRTGPAFVEKVQGMGHEVFLDLKFHDIPNTVARACQAAAELGVWMVNVHALGGRKMMAAARETMAKKNSSTKLIAVTILTSMGQQDLLEIGLAGSPADHVAALAKLANEVGLDGVVCSPQEVQSLRQARGAGFLLVTPGVRPAGAAQDDQQRIMTPAQALQAGSDYLVIGRPITQAQHPQAALAEIFTEIQ